MSFGLSRGKPMEAGAFGLFAAELPPLPDDLATNPAAAWLDPRAWYAEPTHPFEIEIGSGKGTFLVQEAPANPGTNFLGIEWAKEFAVYAMDRIRRNDVRNVRLLCGDGVEFIRWRVPDGIVRTIHLYFPDPWPKTRHHKRRTISDAFLIQVHRVLEPRGELRVVTDHADYWAWMEEHFSRWAPGTGHQASAGEEAESDKLEARIGMADRPRHAEGVNESSRGWSPRHPRDASTHSRSLFLRLPFERPASAGEGEVVGTNFERKYRREGRPFFGAVLRKV